MKHLWTIICSQGIINSATNNLSLIELIEELSLYDTPPEGKKVVLPFQFVVISNWCRTNENVPETAESKLVMRPPDDKPEDIFQGQIIDLTKSRFAKNLTHLMGFQFRGFGDYKFETHIKDKKGKWIPMGSAEIRLSKANERMKSGITRA